MLRDENTMIKKTPNQENLKHEEQNGNMLNCLLKRRN